MQPGLVLWLQAETKFTCQSGGFVPAGIRIPIALTFEVIRLNMPSTVLLIDDNAIQAATRQTILKRAGYFVIPVLNPQRAIEQLQANEFPAPIDVVITDHVMPGMTGAEFVRLLRTLHPEMPVLVISGMEEAEEEYRDLHVTFRLKPLLPDNLLASVDRMLHATR